MAETIFTKIIAGEVPADIVYEDDLALAFRDIAPQAPVHVLVIPRRPITSISAMTEDDSALVGHLLNVCRMVAESEGIAKSGFRIVTNNGTEGGQTVDHLHFHVLGGRYMTWPPG